MLPTGRVKTLHPGVHGGILARRTDEGHVAALQQVPSILRWQCNLKIRIQGVRPEQVWRRSVQSPQAVRTPEETTRAIPESLKTAVASTAARHQHH